MHVNMTISVDRGGREVRATPLDYGRREKKRGVREGAGHQ